MPRHSPYSYYLCRAPDIAAVGTIFNVFNYDAVSARDSNLSPPRRRADALLVEPRSQDPIPNYLQCFPFVPNLRLLGGHRARLRARLRRQIIAHRQYFKYPIKYLQLAGYKVRNYK